MQQTIIIFSFLCLTACGIEVEVAGKNNKFDWVKEGTRLYYDYYSSQDTIENFRYIEVEKRLYERSDSSTFTLVFDILNKDYKVKEDGLYGRACNTCDTGVLGCLNYFDFLYAPNSPKLNQEITGYSCGKNPSYTNKVIEVSKVVTVPWGTFTVYALKHNNRDVSYWDPAEGLIMYEKYSVAGNLLYSLRLNKIEK